MDLIFLLISFCFKVMAALVIATVQLVCLFFWEVLMKIKDYALDNLFITIPIVVYLVIKIIMRIREYIRDGY